MSEIIGKQIEVGVSLEATRGTLGASTQKWLKYLTTNFREKIAKADDKSQHNSFADADGHRVVKTWVEGELTGNVHADGLGYLLTSLIGAPTTSTVLVNVKDHAFALDADALHPSLSLFLKDGGVKQEGYNGCQVNTLEISGSVEDYVKFNASILGKSGVSNTNNPSYATTEYDFIGKEVTIKMADTEAGLAGATPLCVKNFKVKFDNGTKADHCLGSLPPTEMLATKMSVEGSITKNFVDNSFETLFKSGASKYIQIAIVGDALLDATNHPQIILTLNNSKITNWLPKGNAEEIVTEDVDFKGYYNATDAKMFSLILRNLTASYSTGV